MTEEFLVIISAIELKDIQDIKEFLLGFNINGRVEITIEDANENENCPSVCTVNCGCGCFDECNCDATCPCWWINELIRGGHRPCVICKDLTLNIMEYDNITVMCRECESQL